jgi:phenylacetate-CoA ligase
MATPGLGPHFQIELTREGRMDEMTVHVEAAEGPMGTEALEQAAEALKRRIKERVGVSVGIAAHGSGGVPRSQGKAVRIVDNRPKG